MKHWIKCILSIVTAVSLFSCTGHNDPYPELTGPVMDPSGYLPTETRSKLESMLLEEEKITTNQVIVYVTEKLKEDTIEKEATAVFEKWQPGLKDKDNGILLILAPNERKVRIEVGYGLEDVLTDLIAKRIIDEMIIPNMKAGNPSLAMLSGTSAILEQLRANSPNISNLNCPYNFSDTNSDLHPDTIPFLLKEIKPIKDVHFVFCVLPLETQFGLETSAHHLFLNRQKLSEEKKAIVFVSSPKNEFMGAISTSPEYNWSLSQNKIRSIFHKRYQEKKEGDFTNFTYRAFLDMLTHIKHNQKIILEKGTGIYDPFDALERFSYDRSTEIIRALENKYKIGVQILLLDTTKDPKLEIKKYHTIAFGNTSGITLLFSLNQKQFIFFTNEYSEIKTATMVNPRKVEESILLEIVTSAIRDDQKSADIDWMCINSTKGIETYLELLSSRNIAGEENSKASITTLKQPEMKEAHFVLQFMFVLMFFVCFVGFLSGEGIPFFLGLFYIVATFIRSNFFLLPDSPNLYVTLAIVGSVILTTIVLYFFRKIGLANTVSVHTSQFFTSSGTGTGYGSSSSSSYSGGGGRSGGGGASGSW